MISTRAIFYLVALGVTCVSGFTSKEIQSSAGLVVLECPAEDTTVKYDVTPSSGSPMALLQLLRRCSGDAFQSAFNQLAAKGLELPQFLTDLLFDQALELPEEHFNKLVLWSIELPVNTLSAAFGLVQKLPDATYLKFIKTFQKLPADTIVKVCVGMALLPVDELNAFADHAAEVLSEADFSSVYDTALSVLRCYPSRTPKEGDCVPLQPEPKAVLQELAAYGGFGG